MQSLMKIGMAMFRGERPAAFGLGWLFRRLDADRMLELYPPLFFLGVRFVDVSPDWETVTIRLPLDVRTRNGHGHIFGGAQASLADPVPALAVLKQLRTVGTDIEVAHEGRTVRLPPSHFDVWTRSMTTRFVRPAATDLQLRFVFGGPAKLASILDELRRTGRANPHFRYALYDGAGDLCTEIDNVVAVRQRGFRRRQPTATEADSRLLDEPKGEW